MFACASGVNAEKLSVLHCWGIRHRIGGFCTRYIVFVYDDCMRLNADKMDRSKRAS